MAKSERQKKKQARSQLLKANPQIKKPKRKTFKELQQIDENRRLIERHGFNVSEISPDQSKKDIQRQIKNAKLRRKYHDRKTFLQSNFGLSGKELTKAARLKDADYIKFIEQQTTLKADRQEKYIVAGVRDVTERGEMDDYIRQVFNLGRTTSGRDLTQSILDSLSNPDMQSIGMIGKGYIKICDDKAEADAYENYCKRQEINVVYKGQGVYLRALKVSINIAMSLLYFIDERDKFIQDLCNALLQMDNPRARENGKILWNEFIEGGEV